MFIIFVMETAFAFVSFHLLLSSHIIEACSIEPTPQQTTEIIDTIQELGRKLSYARWENDLASNVILSPLSISTILNLLILGTNGTTNLEIRKALNYPDTLEECVIHKIYQNIFSSLVQSGEIEISLYTRLFVQEGFMILESYTNMSETFYFSDAENLDFKNSPENATETINDWVSDSTKGKIKELFPDPLSNATKCVIVNVIFFNATWENKFSPSKTNGTFYAQSENITIPMMTRNMNVSYIMDTTKGFEMISLPYVGNRFSMYILKPTDTSNANLLKDIEENLNQSELEDLINQMEITFVKVTIPRMKIDFYLELNEDLMDLGINKIFKPDEADFSKFSNVSELYVGKIVHKAILEVAENGTVAAAVTAVVIIGTTSAPDPPPKTFKLNRPSIVFIRDNNNGLILFWAKVMKPEPIWNSDN